LQQLTTKRKQSQTQTSGCQQSPGPESEIPPSRLTEE
jgi:hypothetical protein